MVTRRQLVRRIWDFFFPPGFLLLGAIVAPQWAVTAEYAGPLLKVIGYGVFGGGTVHGFLYNRSRAVFTLWVLFLAGWGAPRLLAMTENPDVFPHVVALLVPLNLLLFAFQRERGVLSPSGLTTIGIIVGEVFFVLLMNRFSPEWVLTLLTWPLFPPEQFAWIWIGQPVVLLNIAVSVVLAVVYFFRRNPVDRGLFWALWAAFFGLLYLNSIADAFQYFAVAGLIVQASVTQHAHRIAYKDELTELPSLRAFQELLPQLGTTFTLAKVEVDKLKAVNDDYGRAAGDQVLRMIGSHLSEMGAGRAFRFADDEFVMVFRGMKVEEAAHRLEGLRVRVERTQFIVRRKGRPRMKPLRAVPPAEKVQVVPMTVSIGVAGRIASDVTTDDIIEAADEALVRAKKGGRNRVKITE